MNKLFSVFLGFSFYVCDEIIGCSGQESKVSVAKAGEKKKRMGKSLASLVVMM